MSLGHRNMGYISIDSSNAIVLTEKPGRGVDADLFYFTKLEEEVGYSDYYLVGARAEVGSSLPLPLLYQVANSQSHPIFRPFMLYNDAGKEIYFCTESTDRDVNMHCYAIDISRPPPSTIRIVVGQFLPPRPPPAQNEQEFGVRNVQVLKTFEDEIHILATAGSMKKIVLYRVPGFENLRDPNKWSYTLLVDEQYYQQGGCGGSTDPDTGRPFKSENRASIVGYDNDLGYLVLVHAVCRYSDPKNYWRFKMFYYDPLTNTAHDLNGSTRLSLPIYLDVDRDLIYASPPPPFDDPGISMTTQIFSYNAVRDNSPRGQGRIYVPLSSVLYNPLDRKYIYARAIIEVEERTKRGYAVLFDHVNQASVLPSAYIHGKLDDNRILVTLRGGDLGYMNELRTFDISSKTKGPPIANDLLGGAPRILLGTKKFNLPVDGLYISSSRLAIVDRVWSNAKKIMTDLRIYPTSIYSVRVRAVFWEAPQRVRIEVINDNGVVEQTKDILVTSTTIDELININTQGRKRFRLKIIS